MNLPFGRGAAVAGGPIYVPHDADAATLEAGAPRGRGGVNAATPSRAYQVDEVTGGGLPRGGPGAADDWSLLPADRRFRHRLPTWCPTPQSPWRAAAGALRRDKRLTSRRPAWCWRHGASVGEMLSVLPLIDRIRARDITVLVTRRERSPPPKCPKGPFATGCDPSIRSDRPAAICRVVSKPPNLGLFVEFYLIMAQPDHGAERGIPLILINGRVSERSFQRWRPVAAHDRCTCWEPLRPLPRRAQRRRALRGSRRTALSSRR